MKKKAFYKAYSYRVFIIIVFVFFKCILLHALPTVGVFKLEAKNVNEQTSIVISNAIFNFVKELKKYDIVDMRSLTIGELDKDYTFDYIFQGRIIGIDEGIQIELLLKSNKEDLTRTISKVYKNINLILLDSRILVSDIFDKSVNLTAINPIKENNETSEETVFIESVDILSGLWKGEEGLERIEIMRGKRAIAFLSSGISLFLQLKLLDGYLIITQSGTANPLQFMNVPDNIAKQAAERGKTPAWRFLLSNDNKMLIGEKIDINIEYSNDNITSIGEITKKVRWIKQ